MGDKEKMHREFPGCPVVRAPCFHCRGTGSIPGRGTKIPQAEQHGKKKKKKKMHKAAGDSEEQFLKDEKHQKQRK